MIARPSETITAAVGTIVAAVLVLLNEFWDIEISTNAVAAIVALVSWIAAGITWLVARRQAAGSLGSSPTGEVTSG